MCDLFSVGDPDSYRDAIRPPKGNILRTAEHLKSTRNSFDRSTKLDLTIEPPL
ncbi:hypothetical protein [Lacihabitans sp. CCS-44]|uniref:hypothetical protein n=1 Tax=Lacihabitans sp. CCS-44 TaxID=2487331 RepID=UPI0020CE36D3|nr:hypothetical protein [Lacihabitans sp. CCS-44]